MLVRRVCSSKVRSGTAFADVYRLPEAGKK